MYPMAFPRLVYDRSSLVPAKAIQALWDMCLVQVESAFGGFGIYSGPALRQARPRYGAGHRTEHEAFHRQLVQGLGGTAMMIVDPRFRPEYEFASAAFWERAEQHLNATRRSRSSAPTAARVGGVQMVSRASN